MAETLGSLCDKLTIVKLKQYHCADVAKGARLAAQETQLAEEIGGFLGDALRGLIPPELLTFRCRPKIDFCRWIRQAY